MVETESLEPVLLSIGALVTVFGMLKGIPILLHGRLTNQDELDRSISEESERLSLQGKIINSSLGANLDDWTSRVRKISENGYEVKISGFLPTLCEVRHELYHIYKGHADRKCNGILDLVLCELQANVYGYFGIRM